MYIFSLVLGPLSTIPFLPFLSTIPLAGDTDSLTFVKLSLVAQKYNLYYFGINSFLC